LGGRTEAGRQYLIVDDNRAFAENLAEILGDVGAETHLAFSGAEALQAVRHTRFSALLTDMRMPVMTGAQVVHELRRVDPGLPAMVMTAYSQDDDVEHARQQGLLSVLSKPVPVPRLLELLSVARRDGLVALVEDDAALRDNLSEALRARGLTAVHASSVMEAEQLASVRPFAAVVDLRLPGGPDGEAMRRLEGCFPGLPMIVLTAHREADPPVKPAALFHKPYPTEELLNTLDELHARAVT
jgi:CheY-like chemotaxis protein